MSRRDEAVGAFRAWLSGPVGNDRAAFSEADWAISAHRDAFVFAPGGGRRSNLLHLVLGSRVRAFSPATESLDEAYEVLAGQER